MGEKAGGNKESRLKFGDPGPGRRLGRPVGVLEGKRRGHTPRSGPVGGRLSQGSWLQPEAAFPRSGVSPSGASQGGGSWARPVQTVPRDKGFSRTPPGKGGKDALRPWASLLPLEQAQGAAGLRPDAGQPARVDALFTQLLSKGIMALFSLIELS